MSDNNIDQLFKEALRTRREKPSADAWHKLEHLLEDKQKPNNQRIILFRVVQLAALVLLVLLPRFTFWQWGESKTEQNSSLNLVQEKAWESYQSSESAIPDTSVSTATVAKTNAVKREKESQNNIVVQKNIPQAIAATKKATEAVAGVSTNNILENKESPEKLKKELPNEKAKNSTMVASVAMEEIIPKKLQTFAVKPLEETIAPSLGRTTIAVAEAPKEEVKVIINLSEELLETDSEKSNSAFGKFWNKLKKLPIGESD